jgi:hypothetical protein
MPAVAAPADKRFRRRMARHDSGAEGPGITGLAYHGSRQ